MQSAWLCPWLQPAAGDRGFVTLLVDIPQWSLSLVGSSATPTFIGDKDIAHFDARSGRPAEYRSPRFDAFCDSTRPLHGHEFVSTGREKGVLTATAVVGVAA